MVLTTKSDSLDQMLMTTVLCVHEAFYIRNWSGRHPLSLAVNPR